MNNKKKYYKCKKIFLRKHTLWKQFFIFKKILHLIPTTVQWWAVIRIDDYHLKESNEKIS
jgi:hypothetical protein